MAEPQSLPGRSRRPRPGRAMRKLVIWYRRTGPVITLVASAGTALNPWRARLGLTPDQAQPQSNRGWPSPWMAWAVTMPRAQFWKAA
jgi:hypothetical protein